MAVRIPTEYQEVEYLESTGTQYIDLPYGFDVTDKVEIVGSIDIDARNDNFMISPAQWNTSSRFAMLGVYESLNKRNFSCGLGNKNTVNRLEPLYQNDGLIHKWVYENKRFTVYNDASYIITSGNLSDATFGDTTEHLILFYGYNSNTSGKICKYIQYKNNECILNLIPCYRKSDSEPGMYDTVSKTFYINSGTGTFLVGNDVSWDTASLLERRKQILLNTPHIESASGSMATFNTDMSAPLMDCKVYFEPEQWDDYGVKNLINNDPDAWWENNTIATGGARVDQSGRIRTKTKHHIKPNTTYTLSASGDIIPAYHLWTKDMGYISDSGWKTSLPITFTTPSNAGYIEFVCKSSNYSYIDLSELGVTMFLQLEEGNTATEYEEY